MRHWRDGRRNAPRGTEGCLHNSKKGSTNLRRESACASSAAANGGGCLHRVTMQRAAERAARKKKGPEDPLRDSEAQSVWQTLLCQASQQINHPFDGHVVTRGHLVVQQARDLHIVVDNPVQQPVRRGGVDVL